MLIKYKHRKKYKNTNFLHNFTNVEGVAADNKGDNHPTLFCMISVFHIISPRYYTCMGGTHIDIVYVYVPAFWGTISLILV